MAEESAFGYDEMSKQTFYGLRAHLRVCWPGVIVDVDLAPANAHDLRLAEELLEEAKGWALGDRNYWSPDLTRRLGDEGLHLLVPYKSKKKEKGEMATLVDAKETPDRDGDLSQHVSQWVNRRAVSGMLEEAPGVRGADRR